MKNTKNVPARITRRNRKPVVTETAVPVPVVDVPVSPFHVPVSLDDVFTMATSVTRANIADALAAAIPVVTVNAPGKNVGRFTGTRVQRFQNTVMLANDERRLNDAGLLFVFRCEHPNATGAIYASPDMRRAIGIVAGIRNELNRNGHGEPERKPAGWTSVAYNG